MVRILPNGDIVQDNNSGPTQRTQPTNTGGRRIGRITDHTDDNNPNRGAGNHNRGEYQQQPSIFETMNQRLLENGFPRFDIGQWKLEPIVTVGFILAFLLLGFRGLLFGIILFIIVNVSNTPSNGNNNNGGNNFRQIIASFFNMNGSGYDNRNNNNNNRR